MIRDEVDQLYQTIKEANGELDFIRENCSHKETRIGLYSWRIGCIDNAEICSDCDKLIKTLGGPVQFPTNFEV